MVGLAPGADGQEESTGIGLRASSIVLHIQFRTPQGSDRIEVSLGADGANGLSQPLLVARFPKSALSPATPIHFRLEGNDQTYSVSSSASLDLLEGALDGSHGRTPIPNLTLAGLHIEVWTFDGPTEPAPQAAYDNVRVAEPGL